MKIFTIFLNSAEPQQPPKQLPPLDVETFNNAIMQEWLQRGDHVTLRRFMRDTLLPHRNNSLKIEEHNVLLKLEKDKKEKLRLEEEKRRRNQAMISSAQKPPQPQTSVPKLWIKIWGNKIKNNNNVVWYISPIYHKIYECT